MAPQLWQYFGASPRATASDSWFMIAFSRTAPDPRDLTAEDSGAGVLPVMLSRLMESLPGRGLATAPPSEPTSSENGPDHVLDRANVAFFDRGRFPCRESGFRGGKVTEEAAGP